MQKITQVKVASMPSFMPVLGGFLQCRSTSEAEPSEVPPVVHEVLHSLGQPLDAATRTFMELRLGHDFSRVRVHTDTKAAESARAVDAQAYTVGQDVVFGARLYAPETNAGRRLLAHELTHTVQQARVPGHSMLQRAAKGSATFGSTTEEKTGEVKTTTEASLKLKVPVLPGGKIGRLPLLEDADLRLNLADKRISLAPDDPAFRTQLEVAPWVFG